MPKIETPITSRLLTVPQAAEYLNVSRWQVRTLEWSGELRSIRNLGKRLLFDRADLDALVEARKTAVLQ